MIYSCTIPLMELPQIFFLGFYINYEYLYTFNIYEELFSFCISPFFLDFYKKSICIIQRKIIGTYYKVLHTRWKKLSSGWVDALRYILSASSHLLHFHRTCIVVFSVHCRVWNLIAQFHHLRDKKKNKTII